MVKLDIVQRKLRIWRPAATLQSDYAGCTRRGQMPSITSSASMHQQRVRRQLLRIVDELDIMQR